VEAIPPEVRIYPLSKLMPFYYIKTPFIATDITELNLLRLVGTPYSKWEAFKAAFTKNTNNDKVIQCAKLVNQIFSEFNPSYKDLYDTPESTVSYTLSLDGSELHYIYR
jgi:hypothetical protein